VLDRLLLAVQVVAFLAAAGLAVDPKHLLQLVEQVGLGAEVAEVLALFVSLGHRLAHGHAVVAVEAVPLDHDRCDFIPVEDMLEGAFDSGGAGARGAGYSDDGMLLGHGFLPSTAIRILRTCLSFVRSWPGTIARTTALSHSQPGAKGSRNNNYPFWNADSSRPAVLRKGLHRLAMRPFPRLAGRASRRPKTGSYQCASP